MPTTLLICYSFLQCPSIRDGTCVHPYCKFAEEAHPPGTKYKSAYIHAN
jgi:hypothetical protein